MKNTYQKILITAITVLLAAPLVCAGSEKKQEDIWSKDNPKAHRKWQKEHFGPQGRIRKPSFGQGAAGNKRGQFMGYMREKHDEYIKWLEKNYPEKAEKLAELKEKNPKLYFKYIKMGHRKCRRIMEAEEESPQLAKVLKQDMELKGERDKLLKAIRKAGDNKEKEKLTGQLKEVVSSRFDLIVKRKQIAYEQLQKKLEELKKRVEESQVEAQKWNKLKDQKVKERLEVLLAKTEKFNWD